MKDLFGHDKVEDAIERLRMFCPPEGYYGAFSGGKDSCVIKELAKMAGVKVDWHYNVTTIDPPELIYFIRKQHPDVAWNRPEEPFLSLLPKRGFPTRQNRWCCEVYKEKGGAGRRVMTGVRAAESLKRSGRKMIEQCYRNKTVTYVNPIIDWTDIDVWQFIKASNVPYCPLYDEGFRRLGCVMCPMSSRQTREGNRWPRMQKAFEKAFEQLYANRGDRPAFKRWKDGKDMFQWWLHDIKSPDNPDQSVMFE